MKIFNFFISIIILLTLLVGIYFYWKPKESNDFPYGINKIEEIKLALMLEQVINEDKEDIWPSFSTNSKATIISFDSGTLYGYNLKSANSKWNPLEKSNKTYFTDQDEEGIREIQTDPNFTLQDEKAFIFHFDWNNDKPIKAIVTFLQENFKNYEKSNFNNSNTVKSHYIDHHNLENLVLMQIEEKILIDFLSTNEQKLDLLKDFIAVNSFRRSLMQAPSVDWELYLQLKNGMATYVAVKYLEESKLISNFGHNSFLLAKLQKIAVNDEVFEKALKRRHYKIGAALGFALDSLQVPGWKIKAQQGESPVIILEEYLKLSPDQKMARVQDSKKRYKAEAIETHLREILNEYHEEINELLEQYETMDGIPITLQKPKHQKNNKESFMFNYYLHDGTILTVADSSTYASANNNWVLKFKGMPIVQRHSSHKYSFKIENSLKLQLDGREIALADILNKDQTILFQNSISWKSKNSEFQSGSGGTIAVSQGRILINFDE